MLGVHFEEPENVSNQARVLLRSLFARQELAVEAVLALKVLAGCAHNVVQCLHENLGFVRLVPEVNEAELDSVN